MQWKCNYCFINIWVLSHEHSKVVQTRDLQLYLIFLLFSQIPSFSLPPSLPSSFPPFLPPFPPFLPSFLYLFQSPLSVSLWWLYMSGQSKGRKSSHVNDARALPCAQRMWQRTMYFRGFPVGETTRRHTRQKFPKCMMGALVLLRVSLGGRKSHCPVLKRTTDSLDFYPWNKMSSIST